MEIRTIFTDVGGVLLTNGWDTQLRKEAAGTFKLNEEDVERRHEQVFDDYETGRISLDEYLRHVIFFEPRSFSFQEFKDFIFQSSKPYPEMIRLLQDIKARTNAKVAVLSNEGREIASYRFLKYGFREFVDYYIVSSYVRLRKPDPRIFKLALDLSQEAPKEVVYIEDRAPAIETAKSFGIQAIHHKGFSQTRAILSSLTGFVV